MTKKLFGTDGIRGKVNQYPMTAEVALKFGMAAGVYLHRAGYRNRALIAKDTRLSGYLIEPAVTAGLISVGVDVTLVGPMPTPAVPMLIKSLRADFGIMISASHNPYYDNGLKLFGNDGYKLGEHCEDKLQQLIICNDFEEHLALPEKLGRAKRLDDAPGRYVEHVKNSFPKDKTLNGMRIVLDCANGGAYRLAPAILWELGAEVISIGCEPNGFNINEGCGAVHMALLSAKVIETRADIGIALDGDADRVIICDELGQVVHVDHVIAAIALSLKERALLNGSSIVVTHMSNSALDEFLAQNGISVYRCKVGDKHVSERMKNSGCNFGAEQSGHIVFSDHSTTGDGILAALQILTLLIEKNCKASDISDIFKLRPQIRKDIGFLGSSPLEDKEIIEKLSKIQNDSSDVRIIVRPSGTEKLIRIMVEGQNSSRMVGVLESIENILSQSV
ncbi:phosphoglucosamine mutase [Candidatus Lariskella endosymbiont of Epinotia ramella]|uniref:phosphoglucosamine mutase n=1 Tax=Candidatus Lariskella endosymbiont of Epinotia ramella TaxID=3066224 RepID=UPI0030CC3329